MVNVDIDKDLYEDIKQIVKEDRLKYPSIRHFVQSVLLDKVTELKKEEGFIEKIKSKFKRK